MCQRLKNLHIEIWILSTSGILLIFAKRQHFWSQPRGSSFLNQPFFAILSNFYLICRIFWNSLQYCSRNESVSFTISPQTLTFRPQLPDVPADKWCLHSMMSASFSRFEQMAHCLTIGVAAHPWAEEGMHPQGSWKWCVKSTFSLADRDSL